MKNTDKIKSNVVEFVTFKLKEGVTEQQFLNASDELNANFLSLQKGYINRKLIREENIWADIVLWETIDDAMNAMNVAQQSVVVESCPDYFEYFRLMEESSCEIKHLTVVKNY